ncbi:MAG: hypothetical protein ACK5JD_11430 [Mangrovibacterium sp.]
MDKIFTWFELFSASVNELNNPIGAASDSFCETDVILMPSREVLNKIFSFARSYETLETSSVGYAELFLN